MISRLLYCLSTIGFSLALTKVIVPATYNEYQHGLPDWITNATLRHRYGYSVFLYQKLNSSAPNYIATNRGTEGGVYLRYIVDHYDNFPDVAVFVHAHPHEHNPYWLELVGCISPNASYISISTQHKLICTYNSGYW